MSKITRVIAKVIKVACYCRVSTDEQKKHGYSIATQISQLKDYVDAHDKLNDTLKMVYRSTITSKKEILCYHLIKGRMRCL